MIEDMDVKKGLLVPANPEAVCSNIKSCTIISFMADESMNFSPDNGWRLGSTLTLLHTSDRTFAVKSLMSLCLSIVKPSPGQESSCSMEKVAPQVQ